MSLRRASATGATYDQELAIRRLKRWRQELSLPEARFTDRLREAELEEEDLLRLLGEPIEHLAARVGSRPEWLGALLETFQTQADPVHPVVEGSPLDEDRLALLNPVAPLITRARQKLREGIEDLLRRHPEAPFDAQRTEAMLSSQLPAQLLPCLTRTLALELHAAQLEDRIQGDSPERRFRTFVEGLRQPEPSRQFLAQYPVLARQVVVRLEQWVQHQLEVLGRLCLDANLLARIFFDGHDFGPLSEVRSGAGDQHDGRSVEILGFANGLRLVYKPRSLAVEEHFQNLLAWLDQAGDHPPFRRLEVLDRGPYGWVEWVEAKPCSTPQEVERFYLRLGGYLALLHTLVATDFHMENVIAAGEHPVMVDLEALFHPRLEPEAGNADRVDSVAQGSLALGSAVIDESVLRVGLLPRKIRFRTDAKSVDLSGLGSDAGQPLPFAKSFLEDVGTDRMRIERRRLVLPEHSHRPRLTGRVVSPVHYREALLAGFTSVYRTLAARRGEILAADGPLARFADAETRVVLRPTTAYARLLDESFHPMLLGNALDRDRLFDRLRKHLDAHPVLSTAVEQEQTDLWHGDIPRFTTRPASRDLRLSSGGKLPSCFQTSGLDLARRRIEGLCEDDLRQQSWIVEASLATLAIERHSVESPRGSLCEGAEPVTRQRLLSAACAIGERLEAVTLRGDGGAVSWVGLELQNGEEWSILPLGSDLYGGIPGIALFLGYLSASLEAPKFRRLARQAWQTLARNPGPVPLTGGFSGWGGLLYTAAHLGTLWNDPALLDDAAGWLDDVSRALETQEVADVVGGLAGCILGLLAFHRATGSETALAAAVRAGERLESLARPLNVGIGWPSGHGGRPLAGFSHGAAGIALALQRLSAVSKRRSFRRTALEALAHERSLFSHSHGNWADLREPALQFEKFDPYSSLSWCHGAPGIGLARLAGLDVLDGEDVRREIELACETTVARGFGQGHSLCHGDLGNLELLVQAGPRLGTARFEPDVERLAAATVEGGERHGWICGTPGGVETPGLMMGLAGIGFGLLRLADQVRIPSVLMLQPPAGCPASSAATETDRDTRAPDA